MKKKYKYIDLFAGIGGFRQAFESNGNFECVFSSEFNKACQQVYSLNYGDIPSGDITKINEMNIPNFDILSAGFPCQPFSISGKKKGFEDTRGTLFFDICRIIKAKEPKVVLLENVRHLIQHDKGKTFKVILKHLLDLGYNVSYKVLNAKDFGLPQTRERVFIVASKYHLFDFEKLKTKPPVILKDFLDIDGDFEYLEKEEYTLLDKSLIKKQPKSGLIFCGYRNKNIWEKGVLPNTLHLSRCHRQPNRIYSIEGTHPTIPSQETSGRFFIYDTDNDNVRKLTINECYRIMGFPDSFQKHENTTEQYRQIGNSVAIPVVSAIINGIEEQNLLENKNTNKNGQEKDTRIDNNQFLFNF